MDKSLYVSMTGASEVFTAQAVKANNLANISTPGFKAALVQQSTVEIAGEGLPTRAYAQSEMPGHDFSPGAIQTTNNPLDVSIRGEGWFVAGSNDGSQALTRRGDLKISDDGILVNGAGFEIHGSGGPITIPPAQSISIAEDGQISIVPLGSDSSTKVVIGKIKLANPNTEDMEIREDGLFTLKSGAIEEDSGVGLHIGCLETSNVNPVNELVDLIALTRKYELDVKMMKTAEDNDSQLAQLLQL